MMSVELQALYVSAACDGVRPDVLFSVCKSTVKRRNSQTVAFRLATLLFHHRRKSHFSRCLRGEMSEKTPNSLAGWRILTNFAERSKKFHF